ncbi:hypothetical protein BC936DRAFT_140736 [Jimgerdemannia flammicorona]|uniref:Zn(2)-C6 fungal-type domain-containing protein n=1 Tax=Jimgerdemannia flammicorona TaxID=994334 RepID=A0A433AB21_9FUNG|nr:hypothetical protein BC936DRAFT_140736 [Jimgerdemannia flammicorona]
MISFHNRNSPCQACRRSRRKCLPGTDGNDGGPCGRCERLKFECVHEAPSLKGVAKLDETEEDEIVEKAQMIEDVAELQRQLASLEKEVQTMRVVTDADFPPLVPLEELAGWPSMEIDIPSSPWSSDLTISEVSEDDGDTSHNIAWSPQSTLINSPTITAVSPHQPSPTWTFQNAHYHNWKVTLRPQGLRIHTNIRSFQDLMDFALVNTDHMRADDPENPLSSAYLNRFHRPLQKVTMTDFPLEDSSAWIFLKVLDRRKADQALPIEIIRAGIENTVAGLLYNAYFACLNLYRPLFYRPTTLAHRQLFARWGR